MRTAELLTQRLELAYRWYLGMINADTGLLEYLYLPQTDRFVREKCPIRDIASVWDVEVLGAFLNRNDFHGLIKKSLDHYGGYLIHRNGFLILDPRRLREPSSIAHSAFMLLALLYAPPPATPEHSISEQPGRSKMITGLAEGILRQQRPNGAYQVYFHDLPDQGEKLYAGEAMLALLETYRQVPNARLLISAENGLSYYDRHYFQSSRVGSEDLVFFTNWQSQAGRVLFDVAPSAASKQDVAAYLYWMHDRIIGGGYYEDIERFPEKQVSVEVACALEGLGDAYAVAHASNDDRAERYRGCIRVGLHYLLQLQCTTNGTERERGGFGLSLQDRTQRIDITGHAVSALIKSLVNEIDCRPKASH